MAVDLERSVNHRIASVSMLAKRAAIRTIAREGLDITPEQWTVLYYLWQEDGLPVGELVRRTKKDFANVTRIVDKLLRTGYVRKERDRSDGRTFHIYLLPAGLKIRDGIESIQEEVLSLSLAGITEHEQEMMLALLARMEANIAAALEKQ